jgi:hypothetical protein
MEPPLVAAHGEANTYELGSWPGPAKYVIVVGNMALVAGLIIAGPLWAKIFFGYYLLIGLLTLARRHVTLAPNELQVRIWTLMRIPYGDVATVNALPSKGIRGRLTRLWTAGGADVEVILNRRRWVFLLFPFPISTPTRRLRLSVKDSTVFVQVLRHRLASASNTG